MLFALLLACRPPAPPPTAAPPPARSDALYFALVDRFADGAPDAPGTTDRDDPQAWHGGDLAGLIARLPHLDELGFGALWISPITRSRHEKNGPWGAYHGYWMLAPDEVDPRFGTLDELRALSDAAHARGMRLYLDLVVNHVGYGSPLPAERPTWFHDRGSISDWSDPEEVVTHAVHGLPDLAQENPEVARWLTDAALHWVREVQPDGFRIDAVRHVPPGFLAELGRDVKREAKPGFQTLGEIFDGNPARLGERVRSDALDSVFDFPLMYGIVESGACVDGAPLTGLATNLFTERHLPQTPPGPLSPLVTLLDNHDVPRLASRCARPADALLLMYGLRGTPSVTWGTEALLDGAHEPENRADMPWDGPRPLDGLLRDLNGLRARWPVLQEGAQRLLDAGPEHLLIARTTTTDGALVAVRTTLGSVELPPLAEGWRVGPDGLVPWAGEPFVGTAIARPTAPLPPLSPAPDARIRVDAPAEPGVSWSVTGTAPELGVWDAARAVPVVDGEARIALPPGTATAVKLLRTDASGVRWSQAADVLLRAGGEVVAPWVDAP